MQLRLTPAVHFRAETTGSDGEFGGYASTFGGPPDSHGTIIAPGAFSKSLASHKRTGSMPAMLWAHDIAQPVGRWLSVREDAKGLAVAGKLTLGLQIARDARALMKDGALGLSIGFNVPEGSVTCGADTCTLSEIELVEISLAPVPINRRATIDYVKGHCGCQSHSVPELQKHFQEQFGVSRSVARRLAFSAAGILGEPADPEHDDHGEAFALAVELNSLSQLYGRF